MYCARCGRALIDEKSINLGYGKVCYKKQGESLTRNIVVKGTKNGRDMRETNQLVLIDFIK